MCIAMRRVRYRTLRDYAVEYPVNPKLTLNLKTDDSIGLHIPTQIVFLADEVIE